MRARVRPPSKSGIETPELGPGVERALHRDRFRAQFARWRPRLERRARRIERRADLGLELDPREPHRLARPEQRARAPRQVDLRLERVEPRRGARPDPRRARPAMRPPRSPRLLRCP